MNDATDKFLDVTQAAEKLYEALRELKQRTEDYAEAGGRLESAAARTQALADATAQVLEEQERRWNELTQVLGDQVRPALDVIKDHADKQTVHLSSLSAAVAGQQSQITLVQQGVGENSAVLGEIKKTVGSLDNASSEQTDLLKRHSTALAEQQQVIDQVRRTAKTSMRAAVWAAVFSLAALIAVIVLLVT